MTYSCGFKMIAALLPQLQLSDLISFFRIGKKVDREFENQLGEKFNSKYCITFSSGRAGLYNILKANKIQNKTVLITAYTCSVVAEAIIQSGNTPVFIDTKAGSFNAEITKNNIRENISKLGAIIVTNLYGDSTFSDSFGLNMNKNILVILDDALSPGHLFGGTKEAYDYSFISCEVRKPFSCLGGGIVFTNKKDKFHILKDYSTGNKKNMKRIIVLKKFILSLSYFFAFRPFIYSFTSFIRRKTGFLDSFFNEKYNDIYKNRPEYYWDMCDFQKRIGLNQLEKINLLLDRRREIGNLYFELFSPNYQWIKQFWKMDTPYSHIPFLHPNRNKLQEYLIKNGIETEIYFDYIIPELNQYNNDGEFLRAKHLSEQMINLPIHAALSKKSISKIVEAVKKFDNVI